MSAAKARALKRSEAGTSATRAIVIALVVSSAAACMMSLVSFGISEVSDWPGLSLTVAGVCGALLLPSWGRMRGLGQWRLVWAWLAFMGWATVSAVMSPRVFPAVFGDFGSGIGLLSLLAAGLIALAAMNNAGQVGRLVRLAAPWAVLIEVIASAYYVLAHKYSLTGGTFSNSSYLALFIVLILPAAFFELESRRPWFALGTVVLALGVLAYGGARAGIVVLVVWSCAIALARLRGPKRNVRRVAAGWLGLVAVGGFAVLVRIGFSALSRAVSEFLGIRLVMIRAAWQGALERPILGWGPDGYTPASYAHVPFGGLSGGTPTAGAIADPHNIFMWVLVSTGFVGLGLLLWMMVEIAIDWRAQSAEASSISAPFVQGIVMYAVLCLTAPAALQTLPVAMLILGCSLGARATRPAQAAGAAARWARWVIVVPAAGLCLLLGAHYASSIALTPSVEVSLVKADSTQRMADLWRFDPRFYERASNDWAAVGGAAAGTGSQRLDLLAIEKAVRLAPQSPVYALEYARALAYYGRAPEEVVPAFLRVQKLFPALPNTFSALAEYYLSRNQLAEARAALDKAKSIGESADYLRVESVYWQKAADPARAQSFDAQYQLRIKRRLPYWDQEQTEK